MSNQAWVEPFLITGEDGAALANSTTATSLLPAARKFTLASYMFDNPGKALRFRAWGRISTLVTSPGTLKLDLRLGSSVIFDGGLMTLNTVAQTNMGWALDVMLTCRSIGTSATILGQGTFESHAVIGSPAPTAGGAGQHMLPYNTAPVVGAGFDSTNAQLFDFYGTWSVANAANSILCHQATLESMN